jgi:hypothetical protein
MEVKHDAPVKKEVEMFLLNKCIVIFVVNLNQVHVHLLGCSNCKEIVRK